MKYFCIVVGALIITLAVWDHTKNRCFTISLSFIMKYSLGLFVKPSETVPSNIIFYEAKKYFKGSFNKW